jgi:hypothetical protein
MPSTSTAWPSSILPTRRDPSMVSELQQGLCPAELADQHQISLEEGTAGHRLVGPAHRFQSARTTDDRGHMSVLPGPGCRRSGFGPRSHVERIQFCWENKNNKNKNKKKGHCGGPVRKMIFGREHSRRHDFCRRFFPYSLFLHRPVETGSPPSRGCLPPESSLQRQRPPGRAP